MEVSRLHLVLAIGLSAGCIPIIIEGSAPETEEGESGMESSGEGSSEDGSSESVGESGEESDSAQTGDSEGETSESDTDDSEDTQAGCAGDSDCPGGVCLAGECVSVASCLELDELDLDDVLSSGVYTLDPDGEGGVPSYQAYCEMEVMGGGWTLVLKSDGAQTTFDWSSALWTNEDTFQPEFPDFDRREAKLRSYTLVSLSEVLVGFEVPIGADPQALDMNWISFPAAGSSLHALIAPGEYIPTQLGREAWKGVIEGSSLQVYCNREGINAADDVDAGVRVRIGIIANEYEGCGYNDSRIGVGGYPGDYTEACGTLPLPTGNFAGCQADNGTVNLPAFATVFVR